DKSFKNLLTFEKDIKLKAYPVPNSLKKILRPYQKHGYYWLSSLNELGFSGILADDMGLGKTLQVLTLLLGLKEKLNSGPSLLVVPKTLIYNWEIEIKKFTPSLSYILHTGKDRDRDEVKLNGHDLVITSYALMRIDFTIFDKIKWNYLILDEAQVIKNPSAQVTQAVKKLAAEHRLSLSGTPVENSPVDLWSHFDFLMPGFLEGINQFKERYNEKEPKDLRKLRDKSKPFILRRLKSQVCTELPLKTEITLFCEFTDDQKDIYDHAASAGKKELADKRSEQKSMSIHILTLLLRLRQISCHPSLALPDKESSSLTSGKHELVLSTAEEIISEGHKVLIFSQFTQHLKILKNTFTLQSIENFYLDGSTIDRQGVIRDFQDSKNPCVFFMSLKAGGLGLNLTEASYVFLLDPWWNPAVENQAIDRCYRIGQENPVTVYRFITRDSIEEKVSELQEIKNKIEKAVIGESEIDHVPLTEERLEALLEAI
ncbi:DEAD/DEAH box helicase, partial [Thermodesulfobacteriota bacterium]